MLERGLEGVHLRCHLRWCGVGARGGWRKPYCGRISPKSCELYGEYDIYLFNVAYIKMEWIIRMQSLTMPAVINNFEQMLRIPRGRVRFTYRTSGISFVCGTCQHNKIIYTLEKNFFKCKFGLFSPSCCVVVNYVISP
jgi:hypothetical protein